MTRLQRAKKILPVYNGTGNIYDFVHKFKHKLMQAGVTDPAECLTLLKSKLEGRAYTASRLHQSEFSNYLQALEFL